METWFIVILSLCVAFILRAIFSLITSTTNSSKTHKLPPGPIHIPIISSFLWFRKSFSQLEPLLKTLHAKYGPIVTLRIISRPAIFISDRHLAYHALVQHGAVFSDRPKQLPTSKIISSNQHNISSAAYGPTWRALRRNLTSEILHPSRIRAYSRARKWVLDILLTRLDSEVTKSKPDTVLQPVKLVDHFQYAMFCLLVLMCFGDKLNEKQIKEIEDVQRSLLLGINRFNVLNFWPAVTKILLRKRWQEFYQLRKNQERVYLPLIRERKRIKQEGLAHGEKAEDEFVLSYVDTLLDLQLSSEGNRKLEEGEIVSLCSEFLSAGTDTTSTALEWIMANLVKYPHIQERLLMEMKGVMEEKSENEGNASSGEEVKEEDLQKMPYLKAVILEGLRRHPPGHFVLPHSVSEDVELNGYLVPKEGSVNFMVAEMGWDPKVWEDPMTFKPERFLRGDGSVEAFDITGSKEIKMMPFGAGRRICPGYGLAMLHLEYFMANLVWHFEWKATDDGVDLSEKQEFTMVMKHRLQTHLSPRF
uniref:Cytochrome P450 oxidase CYP89A164 n=1 Tax=Polygala tenuifolia TaxID=355332 RepID=A0A3G5AQ94_9FABA|nr:cytochrome P450 oxidase CYP89A164 [Polygala tenuifolia]